MFLSYDKLCDNNISENLKINKNDFTKTEYCKSKSTPSLFSWMNRHLNKALIIDASTSSFLINKNKKSAENSDCSNDECLANALKKTDFVIKF